jgi:hypothetical protein
MKPQIIAGWGSTESEWKAAEKSRKTLGGYQDLSTVIVMPTRGMIPARVVDSFMSMVRPPNAKVTNLFFAGLEVGEAYNEAIEMILSHPELSKWPFVLTIEEDNLIPPLALIDLQREMLKNKWDALGALYFTKGSSGVPQIWGDPKAEEWNFRPIPPVTGKVVRTNGTGMGCTLFRTDLFRKIEAPWFETIADERGMFTQDLAFYDKLHRAGIKPKVGVDCRVKVGHLDADGRVW